MGNKMERYQRSLFLIGAARCTDTAIGLWWMIDTTKAMPWKHLWETGYLLTFSFAPLSLYFGCLSFAYSKDSVPKICRLSYIVPLGTKRGRPNPLCDDWFLSSQKLCVSFCFNYAVTWLHNNFTSNWLCNSLTLQRQVHLQLTLPIIAWRHNDNFTSSWPLSTKRAGAHLQRRSGQHLTLNILSLFPHLHTPSPHSPRP